MSAKLIRDRLPDLPGFELCNTGRLRHVVNEREHLALLKKKILEELSELMEAESYRYSNDTNEEGCDAIQAILDFLTVKTGITQEQVMGRVAQKEQERGGFLNGVVWEHS
jgi:predicted house-cleaning noncanonical NTP pyrophosphatase (MazG superfamily)